MLKHFLMLVCGMLCLTSCLSSKTSSERRAARAAEARGEIVIGVVDTSTAPSLFLEGIALAVDDLNQHGGVLGRKITTLLADDRGEIDKGQQVAKKFAGNQDVIAVVGHRYSSVAIPVSVIYEQHGILFMSPGAAHPNLTRYKGTFTFRNIPSDEEIGQQAAEFAYRHGFRKIVIFYERDDASKRLSEIFYTRADSLGIEIPTTRSYFAEWETDFRNTLSDVKKDYIFDAMFIAGRLPTAGMLIRQARDMGITVPFLGSDGLDSPQLWTDAGRAAEGTMVATVFDPKQPTRLTRDFVKRFTEQYGVEPDTWAAQGYDAIQVLAYAIERNGSTVPIVMASTLRFLDRWEGVTGSYAFTLNGDITGKSIFFKIAKNGGFEFLERDAAVAQSIVDPLYVIEDITLRIPLPGEVDTVDPGFAYSTTSIEVVEQLFLGLTDLDPQTYDVVPELAEHWTVSEDGKVYQFHLRHGVTWTDGTPVTAHDVIWAIQRNLNPDTKSPLASMLYIVKNAQKIHSGEITDYSALGVKALDDYTVEFTLERPMTHFLVLARTEAYRPLPRQVIERYGKTWTDLAHIQTNGSYRLAAMETGMVILRKNPTYYDAEHVNIPEVRYYIVPSQSVAMVMYRQRELDVLGEPYTGIPTEDLPRIKTDLVLSKEFVNFPVFCTVAYGFNTKRPPVDQLLVRKAISTAIDRQLLVDLSLRGGEIPATTFACPPVSGAVDIQEEVGIPFNPVQAQQWLAEAGYPGGQGFPEITVLYNTNDPKAYSSTAHPIQAFLKHYLNIPVKLQGVSSLEYRKLRKQPNTPHLFRIRWCADYPDASSFLNALFHPTTSPNDIGWENAEFAKLMEEGMRTADPVQRKAMYKRAEQILCEEEAAVIPLYFEVASTLVNPRVKGFSIMAIFGGQHIRDWSLQKYRYEEKGRNF